MAEPPAPIMVKVKLLPPMMKDGVSVGQIEVELPGPPPVDPAADTPPAEGEEAPAEAPPAEEAPDKPPFYKVADFKAKVIEETGLLPDQVQLFNSKTKGILAEDSEVHECEVYAEGARVVCLTRKTREVEEMDPEGQPTGNKVPTPMELLPILTEGDERWGDDAWALQKVATFKRTWLGVQLFIELMQRGVSLDVQDQYGRTPLVRCAEIGRLPFAEALLLCGADCDLCDEHAFTPLMRSSERGDSDFCKLLISYGAKVDLVNKFGKSALMYAAEEKWSAAFLSLVENGASSDLTDSNNMSSWDWAQAAPAAPLQDRTMSDVRAFSADISCALLQKAQAAPPLPPSKRSEIIASWEEKN